MPDDSLEAIEPSAVFGVLLSDAGLQVIVADFRRSSLRCMRGWISWDRGLDGGFGYGGDVIFFFADLIALDILPYSSQ
jgi:hypothetical protein